MGGDTGGEAVNGGAVFGGTTVYLKHPLFY